MRILSTRLLFCLFVALISTAIAARGEMKQGSAVVKAVSGSASYLDELGFSHPLTVGTVLKEGHTVKTGAESSVDLFLDQNGPNVGVDANSTLRLEKLAYEKTALGTKIDTLLDLKAGQMSGSVKKLISGSRYEVKMPQGVAKVRGTIFYIDSTQGTVHVTSGNVFVTVNLTIGGVTSTRTLTVHSGQSLFIPSTATASSGQDYLDKLVVVSTPPGTSFAGLTKYEREQDPATVTENFTGKKQGKKITVNKPPTEIVVSP
jgi:hypothetical protein